MKVGDLVKHMFDGIYSYGIIIEIHKEQENLVYVRWIGGMDRYHASRDLTVIGKAQVMKVGDMVEWNYSNAGKEIGLITDIKMDDWMCHVCWSCGTRDWYQFSDVKVLVEL